MLAFWLLFGLFVGGILFGYLGRALADIRQGSVVYYAKVVTVTIATSVIIFGLFDPTLELSKYGLGYVFLPALGFLIGYFVNWIFDEVA
ncbi:MAG: hypothetical protein UY40_C0018G0004 [candidate division CPR1 bacterium GW2011_GWC1_49_13]|uniref:Uncharacterized protein n=1 Tax=candidate division CPR1 bacterium GW2011_GWC1_49_13 TaxID=1618342 RepID=A0A0G1XSC2_9BACT|nr:MAG: hypothetical protein UY40_C0018G0004 [candidate division CPR1 bacterium GW2011_GWC1_49_13]